jgi:predicted glycogen debranching enzyme
VIHFGREITGDLSLAEKREWLITNGIGGYGSGTVAGSITRGYHGLLVASLNPPIDRRIMLVKLDETLTYRTKEYNLATNTWKGNSIAPKGYVNIESFSLEGTTPCWKFACADALIEKRIWMVHGENTTYVSYSLVSGSESVSIKVSAVADNRVFHNTGMVAWPMSVDTISEGVKVTVEDSSALPLFLKCQKAQVTPKNEMYNNFFLQKEADRGLNCYDSHIHVADFMCSLEVGETIFFVASAEENTDFNEQAYQEKQDREASLLDQWTSQRKNKKTVQPDWIKQLVLAADQFVVNRDSGENENTGKSIIAGYHWFGDWGRDTMISLVGLTMVTGRQSVAGPILETFAEYISEGMLPNRFPNSNETPEYNTIDATLWFFQAIRSYYENTNDKALLSRLYPKLQDIVDCHIKGTRYNIKMDPSDGLISGGEPEVQLTWMDAKVDNHVITPRIGKPIEVNALWYNALKAMVLFADTLEKDSITYKTMAKTTKQGFDRFWNAEKNYCFDVLDGPNGNETLLRPNQLFAVSLPESLFDPIREKQIVDVCAQTLLTSHGMRSLAPFEQEYIGIYTGDQTHRDGSYHQGTVWGWLIGPFLRAHLKVYNNAEQAKTYLNPFADHLDGAGVGTISEIFDGDAPFEPKGCIAQAWSVAQLLQVYDLLEKK